MAEEGIVVVSKTQLHQLQEKMKPLFPHSLKIFGTSRSIQSGLLEREILVNKWPDFTVLVDKPIPGKGPEFLDNVYSVLTTSADQTDLQEFLLKPGVVDWQQGRIVIGGCPVSAQAAVTTVAEKQGRKIVFNASTMCDMYCFAAKDALPQIATPAGYTIGSLNPEDSSVVASQWDHNSEGATAYIRFLLENYPSVALRDSTTGSLVGYYIQQWFYALGMLYVTEEHRGKGLGKLLVVETARRVSQRGEPVFCYIECSNQLSSRLHQKCGFKKVEGGEINWLTIVAADACCSCKAKCCV